MSYRNTLPSRCCQLVGWLLINALILDCADAHAGLRLFCSQATKSGFLASRSHRLGYAPVLCDNDMCSINKTF